MCLFEKEKYSTFPQASTSEKSRRWISNHPDRIASPFPPLPPGLARVAMMTAHLCKHGVLSKLSEFILAQLCVSLRNPWVNKYVTNRVLRRFASCSHGPFAIIAHVGRRSGKPYETLIWVWPTREGFVIALTYGPK